MQNHSINITRIKAINNALADLRDKVVFVGGATVSLYADRIAESVRPTDDVDVLVELYSRSAYVELEDELRRIGFVNDTSSKFVGRFIIQGFIVDIMTTDEKILGFSNKWYREGFKAAIDFTIDKYHTVKIFSAPYFLASKIEAFKNRGNNDGRISSDFEDIVFVLENRDAVWEEMENAEISVKQYLQNEFSGLLSNKYIEEWIDVHVSFQSPSSTYYILEQLESFARKSAT
jgi:hypothetical protein